MQNPRRNLRMVHLEREGGLERRRICLGGAEQNFIFGIVLRKGRGLRGGKA